MPDDSESKNGEAGSTAANGNAAEADAATDDQQSELSVSFTVVKSNGRAGKEFSSPDGKSFRKRVFGALTSGTATTHTLRGATADDILEQYGQIAIGLPLNSFTLMGTAVNGKAENRLTTKAMEWLIKDAIARSGDNFAYREPLSFILIDDDGGRETGNVLCRLWPPFENVAMLAIPSSSSAVMLNGEAAKNGGEHTYMVLSGGRHKEILKRLLELCIVNDLAHIMIAKNGVMLMRGPVDAAVFGPERPVFPGVNHVVPPVTQGPREPITWKGSVFDGERFLAETETLIDRTEFDRIIAAMKAEKQPEADAKAEEWGKNHVRELVARGANKGYAKAQAKRRVNAVKKKNRKKGFSWEERTHEVLEADFIITLADNGGKVSVREIVANPEKYADKRCADPIEGVEYGERTAVVLLHDDGTPWIYSHAHGGVTDYQLVVREVIDPSDPYAKMSHEERLAEANSRGKAPKPGAPNYAKDASQRSEDADRLIRAAVAAGADEAVRDALKEALKFMAGMGFETFNKKWRRAKETKDGFEAENAKADEPDDSDRPDDQPPRGYRVVDGWMCKLDIDPNGKAIAIRICRPLKMTSRGRSEKGENWGVVVEFDDPDKKHHRVAIPMPLLLGDALEALSMLTGSGLQLASAEKQIRTWVIDLLVQWMPAARTTVASKMGWVDGFQAFVLGNGTTIGDQSYVFQPVGAITSNARNMTARGTVEHWRDTVAVLAIGNPVMAFELSAAFVGPLLDIVNSEGGIIHLKGGSSSGKTTVLLAAASAWGRPDKIMLSWRATANGVEAVAAAANATLLVLDEIGMVSGREAGHMAYMIASGQGKSRADRTGDTREPRSWRAMTLSSGEQDLGSKMNEDGLRQKAGQEIRLIEFVGDGRAHGVFDDLRTAANGAVFADRIKAAALAAHGTAGPAMVTKLITDLDGARSRVSALAADFTKKTTATLEVTETDLASQVRRGLSRFALCAVAGEMATTFGITGWPPGTAFAATLAIFLAWIKERGIKASANAEARIALETTRDHLVKHGPTRFQWSSPSSSTDHTAQREGWQDDAFFWITGGAWKEIHAGANSEEAAKALIAAGYLVKGDGKNLTRQKRGLGRCYCIRKSILSARAGMTAAEVAIDEAAAHKAETEEAAAAAKAAEEKAAEKAARAKVAADLAGEDDEEAAEAAKTAADAAATAARKAEAARKAADKAAEEATVAACDDAEVEVDDMDDDINETLKQTHDEAWNAARGRKPH